MEISETLFRAGTSANHAARSESQWPQLKIKSLPSAVHICDEKRISITERCQDPSHLPSLTPHPFPKTTLYSEKRYF